MGKQKRSPGTYQKINTIFFRDEKNVIMPYSGFVKPEFEYLRNLKWHGEEKIDGTNMRIEVKKKPILEANNAATYISGVEFEVRIAGKTDNAQVPNGLLEHMKAKYTDEKVLKSLGLQETIKYEDFENHGWMTYDDIPDIYTIYGEGYGKGIQKAGSHYIKDGNEFIVFDVKVNNVYLKTEVRDEIAKKLGAPVVPYVGDFTLDEAIEYVRKGFKSAIAEDKDYIAEGLVLRTIPGLRDRMGERLIVKVKYEDFFKYRNVYGTDDPVEQVKNSHI